MCDTDVFVLWMCGCRYSMGIWMYYHVW